MTNTEAVVAAVCGDVLNVEEVGPDDDIFDLGGDSMQAVRIALRLEVHFDVEIAIDAIEGAARVSDVAALIDQQRRVLAAAAGHAVP